MTMKLQECTNMVQAEQFLRGASPTFRKTVETAIALSNHADASQRSIGQNFWASVLQEQALGSDATPTPNPGKGLKVKGDGFVQEELLEGGNKSGNAGSEQSTDNTEPYPQEGKQSEDGQKDMEKMSDTENQMTEMSPFPGQMPMPGMDPNLMKQMAPQMGNIPPMNTPQQIQQMQYTVKSMVGPLVETVRKQNKAIKFLSGKIQEMTTMKTGLDLHATVRENNHQVVRETLPQSVSTIDTQGGPRIYEKSYNLETARADILSIDKMIASSK